MLLLSVRKCGKPAKEEFLSIGTHFFFHIQLILPALAGVVEPGTGIGLVYLRRFGEEKVEHS